MNACGLQITTIKLQAVGLIAAIGDSVYDLKIGTPVAIMTFGGYAEYVLVGCNHRNTCYFFEFIFFYLIVCHMRSVVHIWPAFSDFCHGWPLINATVASCQFLVEYYANGSFTLCKCCLIIFEGKIE